MPEPIERKSLREWREERLLTLAELAAKVGVTTRTVWTWEHGLVEPRYRNQRQLAEALGVQPQQIDWGETPKSKAA